MSAEKKYVTGFRTFKPREGSPDFVLGQLIITLDDFKQFVNDNKDFVQKYEGKNQIKLNMTKSQNGGVTFTLDTYKKDEQPKAQKKQQPQRHQPDPTPEDDLPF
jgi:hypothetical protein